MKISVGTRRSPLALAQVEEVLQALRQWLPDVVFEMHALDTVGDRDRSTSLRALDKTDFFTREIDEMQRAGKCRIAIHSAKDLPDPLPDGLAIAAITKGVDPSDSLVLKEGVTLHNLPPQARIATSSARREESVRLLRPDLSFCDVRGTISERLALLERNEVDGVVIAEAALIRLQLTHLNRIRLSGSTAPLQGQLAILVREEDEEMKALFHPLDIRRFPPILHTGLYARENTFHCPFIQIQPRTWSSDAIVTAFSQLPQATHLLFTSQTAVALFCEYAAHFGYPLEALQQKVCVAIGKATAQACCDRQLPSPLVAAVETAEGVVDLLSSFPLKEAVCFWPHAAGARSTIQEYSLQAQIPLIECVLYDTLPRKPEILPPLSFFEEILFTSPSTVDAFLQFYGTLPVDKKLTPIGPITEAYLRDCRCKNKE